MKTLHIAAKTPAPTETLPDESTLGKAQAAFTDVIKRFSASDMDVSKAKGLHEAEVEKHGSAKIALMIGLAEAAEKGDWSHKYAVAGITAAIEAYEKGRNGMRASSLRQFATECGRAIHPEARKHVAADFANADKLWKAEGDRVEAAREAAKDAKEKYVPIPTPLRDAFKRKYHMVVGSTGMLEQRAKGESAAELADAPLDLADSVIMDEKRDAKKAGKAIERAVSVIQEIAAEFPHKDWDDVIEFLGGMDAKELAKLAAKKRKPLARKSAPSADAVGDATDALIGE